MTPAESHFTAFKKNVEEENTLANLWLARTVIKLSIRQTAIFFPLDLNIV